MRARNDNSSVVHIFDYFTKTDSLRKRSSRSIKCRKKEEKT